MATFFEHQAEARRNTRWLLLGMIASVLATGVGVYAVFVGLEMATLRGDEVLGYQSSIWHPQLFLFCVVGSAIFVAGGSAYRLLSLRGGGARVAEMMGGRLASGQPKGLLEQRLLNVVDEMAIASGVPVPQVFVLENESGINAFAAGFSVDDAAIAVTRGTLEKLTRSELQGVIAHEFSHVLNGDMRLNTRLMGAVFGVLCIGLCGRELMRLAARTSSSSFSSKKEKNGGYLFALGLGVFLVGWVGELMGKMIKAAVSRQREFLADASAAQFTRDPVAVAGALKKIGGYSEGSHVAAPAAEEASHFFFGDLSDHVSDWFATHPPLRDRIARLDPTFQGEFAPVPDGVVDQADEADALGFASSGGAGDVPTHARVASGDPDSGLNRAATAFTQQLGSPDLAALEQSRKRIESLPPQLREAAANPFSACAMVYALWLSEESEVVQQSARIEAQSGPELRTEAQRLAPLLASLNTGERLSLVELAAPALRQLSPDQRLRFARTIESLTYSDRFTSIFEQVVGWMLTERLLGETNARSRSRTRHKRLKAVRAEIELFLSLLAHAGDVDGTGASNSFASAAARLSGVQLQLLPASERLISGLGPALNELRALSPELAHRFVDACAHGVLSDHRVSAEETTLLRAVCDALRCPLPLLGDDPRTA